MLNELHSEIEQCLQMLPADAGGGCPIEKALAMADYIVTENLTYSIEIGVYKGRSFFPQALAQRRIGGVVFGIDPYMKECAREKDLTPQMKTLVDNIVDSWDTVKTYALNLGWILSWKLGNNAVLIRETSEAAAKYLPGDAGLLHIDGNHDIEFVEKDIALYLPKIKSGGLVVMDDTDWASVQACLHLLEDQNCKLDSDHGTWQVWRKA
jgi:hypothetical protein